MKPTYPQLKRNRHRRQLGMSAIFAAVLAGGWIWPWLGYFIPACMLLGIGIALFRGRKWCDWYCPRGSFADACLRPVAAGKPIPPVFRGLPLRLGVLALLMTVMTVQLVLRWPDPVRIGAFFVLLLTVTTAIGVVLALFYHERAWCWICPIGSMSAAVGRNWRPLRLDPNRCTNCAACRKVCPMQLQPFTFTDAAARKRGHESDCLTCDLCVAVCPTRALNRTGSTP